jgi:hypothetical protein
VCHFASDQSLIKRIEQFRKQRANSSALEDLVTTRIGGMADTPPNARRAATHGAIPAESKRRELQRPLEGGPRHLKLFDSVSLLFGRLVAIDSRFVWLLARTKRCLAVAGDAQQSKFIAQCGDKLDLLPKSRKIAMLRLT